jgi:hypothetical protein
MDEIPEDLSELQMPIEWMARPNGSRNGKKPATAVRRYKKHGRIRYYALDANVFDRAFATPEAKHNAWCVLAILVALYELWYLDIARRNPVKLTSENLRRFGLTRKQKYQGLKILEGAKLILVDRTPRRNPMVTLMWKPVIK